MTQQSQMVKKKKEKHEKKKIAMSTKKFLKYFTAKCENKYPYSNKFQRVHQP